MAARGWKSADMLTKAKRSAVVSKAKVLLMGGHHGDVGPLGLAVFRPCGLLFPLGRRGATPPN